MSRVEHGTWSIERTYPVDRSRLFAAWADVDIKRRWFVDADGRPADGLTSDFVVGGSERLAGAMPNGDHFTYHATYRDIVADERIITDYEMTINQQRISVSLACAEFASSPDGSTIIYTEHGIYLNGLDTPESRRSGTAAHLDQLGRLLERE